MSILSIGMLAGVAVLVFVAVNLATVAVALVSNVGEGISVIVILAVRVATTAAVAEAVCVTVSVSDGVRVRLGVVVDVGENLALGVMLSVAVRVSYITVLHRVFSMRRSVLRIELRRPVRSALSFGVQNPCTAAGFSAPETTTVSAGTVYLTATYRVPPGALPCALNPAAGNVAFAGAGAGWMDAGAVALAAAAVWRSVMAL